MAHGNKIYQQIVGAYRVEDSRISDGASSITVDMMCPGSMAGDMIQTS